VNREDRAVTPAATAAAHCKNCDAPLLGRFCVNCSQAADVHVPTTRELMHEVLEGLTHSDSRLWRTLKYLWFKPGKLTQEFVAGRRVAYLPPFRLYLILSLVFFLIFSFWQPARGRLIQFDTSKEELSAQHMCGDLNFSIAAHPDWNQRLKHACTEIYRDKGENWLHIALGTLPKAMFIFLPLVAFLHMLMYWRPRYRYAEQLLFFVHLHAFYFSVAIAMILAVNAAHSWPRLNGTASMLETLLGWSMPVYTVVAMRRVFTKSWRGAFFKAFVLFIVYMAVFSLTLAGVFVYAALQL
jgi:Protein of unknown function (DUF3667)